MPVPIFGEVLYGETQDNTAYFLSLLVDALPPNYRPAEYREFIGRILQPSAEDLSLVNQTYDLLDTFVYPESAPEEWVDWMLLEWWGWRLIPDGYPFARKRQLLSNLHLHYKRRYTIAGIEGLLAEFGIVSEATDRRPFVGGYYGTIGTEHFPLNVRVRILGYEAFLFPQKVYVGGFYHGTYAYTTQQIITEDFVMALLNWSRAAGARFFVEWRVSTQEFENHDFIMDDDEIIVS